MGDPDELSSLIRCFHIQLRKLEVELSCPACLNLWSHPVWLPCNHLICSHCVVTSINGPDCSVCGLSFASQASRPANHLEAITKTYKSMRTALAAISLPPGPQISIPDLEKPSKPDSNSSILEKPQGKVSNTGGQSNNTPYQSFGNIMEERETSSLNDAFINEGPSSSPLSYEEDYETNELLSEIRTRREHNKESYKRKMEIQSSDQKSCNVRELKRKKLDNESVLGNAKGDVSVKNLMKCSKKGDHEQKGSPCSKSLPSNNISDILIECAFCHSFRITEESGRMLHYSNNGVPIAAENANQRNAVHVHEKCIGWTPLVYFEGETAKNLMSEISRAARIKCHRCGLKGAALGCYVQSCRRSYHVPCAVTIPDCRWDCGNYLMLCPSHSSHKLPCEMSTKTKNIMEETALPSLTVRSNVNGQISNVNAGTLLGSGLVLCGSFLSRPEEELVERFASMIGAEVSRTWDESVTHVIASTDENGAFNRTLKVLMGILCGKWILKVDWIRASIKDHPVPEEPYEITHDLLGFFNGPRNGRNSFLKKEPKLFTGLGFYFSGVYTTYYKEYLEELVNTGGGTILKKTDLLCWKVGSLEKVAGEAFVVYSSLEDPAEAREVQDAKRRERAEEAGLLAAKAGAQGVAHTWILDAIASYSLPNSSSNLNP